VPCATLPGCFDVQQRWLKRQSGATELIVVFGGWAIGPAVFSHLTTSADLLYLSDYTSLEYDLPDFSAYQSRSLVAWSFGVASYGHWQQGRPDPFSRKVALNGSMAPADRQTGIAPKVLQKTIDTLSQDSFQVFLNRCFNAPQPHHPVDVPARRAELIAIQARGSAATDLSWDRVWISGKDRIFSPANMKRAWPGATLLPDAAHVPFSTWSSWDEVLA
jgi:pimeloyl-[acyl-carrier protein] methyl ester esterase